MNSEYDYSIYPDENLFSIIRYEDWAPSALIEIHPITEFESLISGLEVNPTIEAWFAVC